MLSHWPISDLTVTTPRVQLRWPTLADLDALASVGAEGVHDPSFMPFFSQWTDGEPESIGWRVMQKHWAALGAWSPADWTLFLVVVADGEVVGSQSIGARQFAAGAREVVLTSWLGRRFQGRKLGSHARAASLALAFDGLGAEQALTVVRRGNAPSQGVCRRFGFVPDGTQTNVVRGEQCVSDRYRLTFARWAEVADIPYQISGLTQGLSLFGLTPETAGPAGLGVPATAENFSGIRHHPAA